MSRLGIFSALDFHFQCQEIPQVQDGRLSIVEEVHPLLHLGAGHPPCIDDRVCMGCFLRRFLQTRLSAIAGQGDIVELGLFLSWLATQREKGDGWPRKCISIPS